MDNANLSDSLSAPIYVGSTPWVVVYTVIICAALAGNVLTLLAIVFSRQLSATIANQFIASLAISDLLVGVATPYHMCFYMVDFVGTTEITCLMRFVLISFACASSIFNLFFIAMDRYIAIVHPLNYNPLMTRRVSMALIAFGWLSALTLATVPIYWNHWEEGDFCDVYIITKEYFVYVLTPLFGLVWCVLLGLYVKIWSEAKKHTRRIRSVNNLTNCQNNVNDTKSIQVVMLTLGCFSVCWMPYFIVTTYYRINVADDDQETSGRFNLYYEIAFTLAAGNSGMNPVIYAWKNSNFREAFWCLLRCQSPNQATKKIGYITNHVPSNKNSIINGDSGGNKHDGACDGSSIEIEMDRQKEIDDYNSCSTDMSNVASIRGA